MKRTLALLLSVAMLVTSGIFSMNVGAKEKDTLYAAVMSFDNKDLSKIQVTDGSVLSVNTKIGDINAYYTEISGTGLYTASIDASGVNFQGHCFNSVVIDSTSDITKLSVCPVLENGEKGAEAELITHNEYGYYLFSEASAVKGLEITVLEENYTYNLTEIFFCLNEYSAKYMIDNNVLPSTAIPKKLVIHEQGDYSAINMGIMTKDEMDVSKGGTYCDFVNLKWPSIIVDENDRIYVAASGARKAHVDPFGSTIIATSDDGGKTYSSPRQISNTIHDDRDVGLTYLGNGKILASYFTNVGYHKGESVYSHIMRDSSHPWDADEWDFEGNPIGGVNGTYLDLLNHVTETDPDYEMQARSYVIKSTDYGKTWSAEPYTLKGTVGVDYTEKMQETAYNYQLTEPGTEVPTTSPHGPVKLSDGTVIWVGKIMTPKELNMGEIGVYVSHDEGDTWQYRAKLPIPYDYTRSDSNIVDKRLSYGDFQEPDVTETKDGALVCALRTFEVYLTYSYDKGATWTTPNRGNVPHYGDQEEQNYLSGVGHGIFTMPNGDLVLTVGWRWGDVRILVYVSEDGGRTWSTRSEFSRDFGPSTGDNGYPGTACLSDGTIITAYYGVKSGDTHSSIITTNWTYSLDPFVVEPCTWQTDTKGRYYIDEDCNIAVGCWVDDEVGRCYLNADGYMATNQTAKENRKYYLVDATGHRVLKTGWNSANGNWYFVQAGGVLLCDKWQKDSKGWCYLSSTGIMLKNRVVKDSKGYCLLDGSGYWVTKPGWQKAGNNWYYVKQGGYLLTSSWMKDSKGWCFLAYDGTMETNKSVKDSKGYCLVDASGYWVTKPGWHLANGDWYYTLSGGYLKTNGWMKDSRGWCYLDESGVMLKNMAVKDSKGWCILDEEGYWQTENGIYQVKTSYKNGLAAGSYHVEKGYIVVD